LLVEGTLLKRNKNEKSNQVELLKSTTFKKVKLSIKFYCLHELLFVQGFKHFDKKYLCQE